jgi:hypothetical protein
MQAWHSGTIVALLPLRKALVSGPIDKLAVWDHLSRMITIAHHNCSYFWLYL